MLRKLYFILLLLSAGCSVVPDRISIAPAPTTTLLPAISSAPPAITLPTSTASATITTSLNPATTRIIVLQPFPSSPLAALSPTAARISTPSTRTGWKTYTSASLHLAIDYPPDWIARAENIGAVFVSPQGVTIRLYPSPLRLNDETIQPNTRCSNTLNPHGISVSTCLATIGFALDAYLGLKLAGNPETIVVISAQDRAALGVVNPMIESARISP